MITNKDAEAALHYVLRDAGILLPRTAEDVAKIEASLEECDCCGDFVGLSDAEVVNKQILCKKCKTTDQNGEPI